MAIYDFSKSEKNELKTSPVPERSYYEEEAPAEASSSPIERGRFFSALAARLFFVLLLVADLIWASYALTRFLFALIANAVTAGKNPSLKSLREKSWVSLRRSLVCGVSLFISAFHPAFGIMIACTYFLMYDKSGIEEVVPSSLQSQFKEFFPKDQ